MVYLPDAVHPNSELTIYIEGDGQAWLTGNTPSDDPTPGQPLALRMALAHGQGNAAYLGRPCQYGQAGQPGCAPRYWTDARFAEEVIAASDLAIEQLKRRFSAHRLTLVGYSGGAAVAALVAARRSDVTELLTVAGNLDHAAWTSYHRVSPLRLSLNPADFAGQLATLPQTHWVGAQDAVMPPALMRELPVSLLGPQQKNLRILPGYDHHCCWADTWALLRQSPR